MCSALGTIHVKRVSGGRTLLTVGFRESTWTEMPGYSNHLKLNGPTSIGCRIFPQKYFGISGHLPTCKRMCKGDIEMKTETSRN